jgi:hypothetical protein
LSVEGRGFRFQGSGSRNECLVWHHDDGVAVRVLHVIALLPYLCSVRGLGGCRGFSGFWFEVLDVGIGPTPAEFGVLGVGLGLWDPGLGLQGHLAHVKRPPDIGPYTRTKPRALWWSKGGIFPFE